MKMFAVISIFLFSLPFAFGSEPVSVVKSKQVIELSAKFQVSQDHEEIDLDQAQEEGWQFSEDDSGEKVFILNVLVPTSELPFSASLGQAYLRISKTGLVRMGMNIGDQDAGTGAELQFPVQGNKLLELPKLGFKNSGGDYASGAWSFVGEVEVSVQKVD